MPKKYKLREGSWQSTISTLFYDTDGTYSSEKLYLQKMSQNLGISYPITQAWALEDGNHQIKRFKGAQSVPQVLLKVRMVMVTVMMKIFLVVKKRQKEILPWDRGWATKTSL